MKRPSRNFVVVTLNVLQVLLVLAWVGVHTEAARATARPAWGWPLVGESSVEKPFTAPSTPWGVGHRGVDLLARAGQEVVSAGDGVVSYEGTLAGRGVVTVRHASGLRTTYEPVTPTVRRGARIEQGQPIGVLAKGHSSCHRDTTCLHWGLLRGKTYLDPLTVVTQGRLRLLPAGAAAGSSDPTAVVAAVGRITAPTIGSPTQAIAEPRSRIRVTVVNMTMNVATAAAVVWGLFALGRRGRPLVRRLERRLRRA